jgi:hypothetical protein
MWNKFDTFQPLLEVNDEAHDHEPDQAESEGTYYKLKSDMERLLASWETGSMSVVPELEGLLISSSTKCSDTAQPVTGVSLELTSVSLLTFYGNYENWVTFESIFEVIVDSHTDITFIEKLSYLLLALKDQAFRLVEGFSITTDNYSIAWNLFVSDTKTRS